MSDDEAVPSKISARLGGLRVEVEGEDMAEVRRAFDHVWEERLEEAGDMADALQSRLSGVQ